MAYLRPDGRYEERKRIGKGLRPSGYGSTPEEAKLDLAIKIAAIQTWTPSPSVTLREFVEHVWRPAIDGLEEGTVKRYTAVWRIFIAAQLGPKPITEIRRAQLGSWQRGLEAMGVKAPTVRYAGQVLSAIMKMAVDYEIIERNPVSSMKLPKKSPKRDKRLSVAQAAELLEASKGTSLAAPVFLACILGLRQGEIAGLKWDDLDRQRGELAIRRQRRASKGNGVVEKGLKTESSKRTLRLRRDAIAEIDFRGDLDSPFICTRNGKPYVPQTIYDDWVENRKAWKLEDWTFHDLRHGAAGLLYATGADLIEIAAVLGHSRPDMSWAYTNAAEDRAGNALGRLTDTLKVVDKTV